MQRYVPFQVVAPVASVITMRALKLLFSSALLPVSAQAFGVFVAFSARAEISPA